VDGNFVAGIAVSAFFGVASLCCVVGGRRTSMESVHGRG